jgi:hypothetical protein
VVLQYGIENGEKLAHARGQGEFGLFADRDEALVER